jgi:hypothetical protein
MVASEGGEKMRGQTISIELPLEVIENVFNVLNLIKPTHVTKLEKKALDLLKDQIYYELEVFIETDEEAEARRMKFRELFEEKRKEKEHSGEKENAY